MIKYIDIQGNDTSADLKVSVDGINLVLEMTYYKSGLHNIQRQGDMVREVVTLTSDPHLPKKVTVYLLDDPVYELVQEPYTFTEWRMDENNEPYLAEETLYRNVTRLVKNEGHFIIWTERVGIDESYQVPEGKLVMIPAEFVIPPALMETTEKIQVPQRNPETGEIVVVEKTIKHGLDQCDIEVRRIV